MSKLSEAVLELMPRIYGELSAKGVDASDAALYAMLGRITVLAGEEDHAEEE